MRIIAGVARGRHLTAPDTSETRPVTDRAREAVFSSIGAWVEDAEVADLYAGSGSFGLEALSRGAKSAVFVERNSRAIKALRSNIETVGLGGNVVQESVRQFLNRSEMLFDLVFIDPPWPMSSGELEDDFKLLDLMLKPNSEIVASRRHSDPVPVAPTNWLIVADKRYGDTRILRYEKGVEKK